MNTSRKLRVKLAKHRRSARKATSTEAARKEPLRAASLGHRNAPREPPQQVGSVKSLAVCLSHSPSEIWPNAHFVFYPADSGPRKRKHQATAADPDSETTSPSDRDTSSTFGGRGREGFHPPGLPLRRADVLRIERVRARGSPRRESQHRLVRASHLGRHTVDTHGDHVGPQNIPDHINHESTALSFLELFLGADFWGLLCHQTNL